MGKTKLLEELSQVLKEPTLNKAKVIFEECDQFRYGFSSDEVSRQAVLSKLKEVLSELNE